MSATRMLSISYRAVGVGLTAVLSSSALLVSSDEEQSESQKEKSFYGSAVLTATAIQTLYSNLISSRLTYCDENEDDEEEDGYESKNVTYGYDENNTADKPQHNFHQRSAIAKEEEDDDFPNFDRHGKESLLRQYLTRDVYKALKDKQTRNGVQLEDIIRAGVSLPWGAARSDNHNTNGLAGVFCGDPESYETFDILLNPLIQEHHNAAHRARLRRHVTNLDFNRLTNQKLDPNGEYILFTRMRLARSLAGFRFAPCIGRGERRRVQALIRECCTMDDDFKNHPRGAYVSVMDMTNEQHDDLVRRQLLFADPDEHALAAGLGRDWPDGRGIYCDAWDQDFPHLMIWCNAQDHVWIVSSAKGGELQDVFTRLSRGVMALETSLKKRGHAFVEDRRLGFLNTSPVDIGTALRASVYVKLVRLGQQPGLDKLLRRLRLEARPFKTSNKRYTGIFDIANGEALGKSEVELINIMIRGVGILIDLEKRLENGEDLSYEDIVSA